MNEYNFDKAKKYIEKFKNLIKTAGLGMHEDWAWTAETIYEDGEYVGEFKKPKPEQIAGISGSGWATPVLKVKFKDGTTKTYECIKDGGFNLFSFNITQEIDEMRSDIEVDEL